MAVSRARGAMRPWVSCAVDVHIDRIKKAIDCQSTHAEYSAMAPVHRFAATGPGLVFVTTTTVDWLPVFASAGASKIVLETLRESIDLGRFTIVGWVLMPSHFHLLIGMQKLDTLSGTMQSLKILTSKRIRAGLESGEVRFASSMEKRLLDSNSMRLWQRGFDDVIIHTERQLKIKLEYIHNNPVRGGLAVNSTDWPNSSASDWLLDRPGPLPIDKHFSWSR